VEYVTGMIEEFHSSDLEGFRAAYDRDGVVIVREVLKPDLIEELERHIDWLMRRHPDLRPESLGHWLIAEDPFWVRFVSDNDLLDVAEPLTGPDIAFFAADYIVKPPRTGKGVLWHQDGNYWPLAPMDVITIWFAVSATTHQNGCVQFVPGSHRLGPQKHRVNKDEDYILNSVETGLVDESKIVDAYLNPGDVSVHHPYILHGSEPNRSTHWRRGGSIQYMPATTEITADTWPSAFLFRGKPVGQINQRHYLPIPKFVQGKHMPFKGLET
jgi:phytanoyl-CoA hydroxylase